MFGSMTWIKAVVQLDGTLCLQPGVPVQLKELLFHFKSLY